MKLLARWRLFWAQRQNDKKGKVTSGRMDTSERSAAFHQRRPK